MANISKIQVGGVNYDIADQEARTHIAARNNPHAVTAAQVGLGNVENKSSATIRSEITSENVTNALGYTPLNSAARGAANGVAPLGADSLIPASYLPAYVDDVLEGYLYNNVFYKEAAHTTVIPAETGKIYVDLTNNSNKTYRWTGSQYVEISSSTVYYAGTGLSLSGTTFNHTNSISAGATAISIGLNASDDLEFAGVRLFDAQGHATNTTTGGGVFGAALSTDGISFDRSLSITPAGSVSQPTFSGNSLTSTGSCTPNGSVSQPTFTGSASTATATYTPAGAVSQPTFSGTAGTASATYTPAGSVSQPTFSGNSLTSTGSCTPRGYVVVDFGSGTFGSHFVQVSGTVSKPNITVTPSSASTLTSVATAGTLPSWSASVSGETLSFSFSAGAMPTFNTGNRLTGASAALASAPEFTGNYISCDAVFYGSATSVSVTGTPSGTVSQPTFTGTAKTLFVAMHDFGSV